VGVCSILTISGRAMQKLKIKPAPEDEAFSAEELAIAAGVRAAIEAMFADARLAKCPEECAAYIRTERYDYIYDVLKNGHWELGGSLPLDESMIETDAKAAISRSLEEIKKRFPYADTHQLVWRLEPEFRRLKASAAMPKWGIPAYPDRVELYLRFTVTPVGVYGGKRN
jgi:hypothetical protein